MSAAISPKDLLYAVASLCRRASARRFNGPPLRGRPEGPFPRRRSALVIDSHVARCETDVVYGAETCIRLGACTGSQRGRRDSLCPGAVTLSSSLGSRMSAAITPGRMTVGLLIGRLRTRMPIAVGPRRSAGLPARARTVDWRSFERCRGSWSGAGAGLRPARAAALAGSPGSTRRSRSAVRRLARPAGRCGDRGECRPRGRDPGAWRLRDLRGVQARDARAGDRDLAAVQRSRRRGAGSGSPPERRLDVRGPALWELRRQPGRLGPATCVPAC